MSMAMTRADSQARTRAALLEAGGRVFVERGFDGASVEAIAAEAGFTRGAFYSNFSSKEQLFTELLQERVYRVYASMAQRFVDGDAMPSMREQGAQIARVQGHPDGRWMFRLWLELLAHTDRNPELAEQARGFWSGNRALMAGLIEKEYAAAGRTPPADPARMASALIAMDIGLALQHHVDPDAVPLDVYEDVWELVFEPLRPQTGD